MRRATQQTTVGHLRIERLRRALSIVSQEFIEPLISWVTDYGPDTMMTTKDGLGIEEVIIGEDVQTPTVEDVPECAGVVAEIPKSPHTPQPKKDK